MTAEERAIKRYDIEECSTIQYASHRDMVEEPDGDEDRNSLRTAIQSEIRELTAIAVSLERDGGDAWRTREKIKAWEGVLGAD